ncbi:Uncharacterised protein [Chlamydia trachomatis]|nr:Uncharacterised protein [Chlamydia trachomatis]
MTERPLKGQKDKDRKNDFEGHLNNPAKIREHIIPMIRKTLSPKG